MLRLAGAFLLICLHAGYVYGMDCSFGTTKNVWEKPFTTCPGFLDSSDKSYCCFDVAAERTYCCDLEEFAVKNGLGIIIPLIIVAAIAVGLILCCISCLCCSCCPWYRRRHQGTVYGILVAEVQTPVVQVIQPQVNLPQGYINEAIPNVPNPTSSIGMPQPPPPYSNEVYAKQAPYNPAYPPSSQ